MSKLSPRIKASISLIPTGSQVVVLALVGIFALCLFCSFLFIWHNVNYWPPLIFSFMLFVAIVFLWLRSHRQVDDRTLPLAEVSIKDEIGERKISMHPRGLPSKELLKNFETILSITQNQKPLPDPDGLVDENGSPIPQSKKKARQNVDAVNNQVKQKLDAMNSHSSVFDQPNETMQSALYIEPNLEEFKKINRPSN